MEKITIQQLPAMFALIARLMADNEERLCSMDAQMGDGDLGLTMHKGFDALAKEITELVRQESELTKILMKVGMKMASAVPSTMGTLMGSGIMGGGKALAGCEAIGAAELARFYRGFAQAIAKRGKCAAGDRTVLDALLPAADRAEASSGGTLLEVAQQALQGAKTGIEATKDMLPKFGKAAVFSARARGCEDQGAVVAGLLAQGIRDFILLSEEETSI